MKTSSRIALAFAGMLALGACKDDEQKNNTGAGLEADAFKPFLALEIPVTRNEEDFTLNITAYCNSLPDNDNYAESCTQKATEAMERKFMCSRFALATGMLLTDNRAIMEAGFQGRYETFPEHFLYTQERLEVAIKKDTTGFRRDFFVINDISDIEAAAYGYRDRSTLPEICTPS